jgi:hypothetical protein
MDSRSSQPACADDSDTVFLPQSNALVSDDLARTVRDDKGGFVSLSDFVMGYGLR